MLLEPSLDALQAQVALDRETERLSLEALVTAVEEGDDRTGLAEVMPSRLNDVGLPPRLLGSRQRSLAPPGKCHASGTSRTWRGLVDVHESAPNP